MQAISLEVIIAVVFGVTDPGRVERLRAATLALMREGNSRRFFVQTMIVTARNKGWDGPFPRIRAAMAAVDAIVLEEAAERRRSGDLDQDDVLGMFLRARDENGNPMPDSELCDAMRTLLLGGHETTASTLAWILERVTRHPDVLARLEAAALDGDDDYIDAVIKEAMRLRPVFPITARLASEDFELGDSRSPPARSSSRTSHSCTAAPTSIPTRSRSARSASSTPAPAPTPGSRSAADPDAASAPRSRSSKSGSCCAQCSATRGCSRRTGAPNASHDTPSRSPPPAVRPSRSSAAPVED